MFNQAELQLLAQMADKVSVAGPGVQVLAGIQVKLSHVLQPPKAEAPGPSAPEKTADAEAPAPEA